MRLVDADEIWQKIEKEAFAFSQKKLNDKDIGFIEGMERAVAIIAEAPTIDLLKYGEWEEDENCIIKCSVCGNEAYYDEYICDGSGYVLFDYCHNCGADMRGRSNG